MFLRRLVPLAAVLGVGLTNLAMGSVTAPCDSVPGNLITNCGFETGDFTGWVLAGNTMYSGVSGTFEGIAPNSGDYQAYFGAVGSDTLLSQTFATAAGADYVVSFYMAGYGGSPSNFSAAFDSDTLLALDPAPYQAYTLYSYTIVAASASSTLTFAIQNDNDYQLLDDVSVTAAPEPRSYAQLGGALLVLLAAARGLKIRMGSMAGRWG